MAFPLATVLKAAPGLISAAADIIGLTRKIRNDVAQADQAKIDELSQAKIDELSHLLEEQARVLEELALNNRNLVLAVRNNRLLALMAMAVALASLFTLIIWR